MGDGTLGWGVLPYGSIFDRAKEAFKSPLETALGNLSDSFATGAMSPVTSYWTGSPYETDLSRLQNPTLINPGVNNVNSMSGAFPAGVRVGGTATSPIVTGNGILGNGDGTNDDETNDDFPGNDYPGSSYGGLDVPAAIAPPTFRTTLDADTIARLSEEAKNYASLAFTGAFSQLDQNLLDAAKIATDSENAVKPVYWQSMRDATAMGTQAAVQAMQGANTLGRLRGGQPGEIYGDIKQTAQNQVGGLQGQLGSKVDDIYRDKADSEKQIGVLRAGYEKEKGLTQQVQRATLMKEQLAQEISMTQMKFENALASSADQRNWQSVNLAYQSFQQQASAAAWQQNMTERQFSAQLDATKLQNQLTAKSLSSSAGMNPMDQANYDRIYANIDETKRMNDATIAGMGVTSPMDELSDIQATQAIDDWWKQKGVEANSGGVISSEYSWDPITQTFKKRY